MQLHETRNRFFWQWNLISLCKNKCNHGLCKSTKEIFLSKTSAKQVPGPFVFIWNALQNEICGSLHAYSDICDGLAITYSRYTNPVCFKNIICQ